MRRWRVVVIDDNPEGSLEAVLLSPLVIAQKLKRDATAAEIERALAENLLSAYLPLPTGDRYAVVADVDFQIRSFRQRRLECGRPPMIEVERDFTRAWRLIAQMAEDPPDIIFLDVMFDQKTAGADEIDAILNEIQSENRIGDARSTPRELLSRGGLFLLGHLLRCNHSRRQMPLVVLYSASRDVQSDFRPFEYAFGGQFEVVEKDLLRNNAERRKQVFRRRMRDYLMDGTVRPADVRAAVNLLAQPEAIAGDVNAIRHALALPVGSGWCFGALFAAESVAYLSAVPARREIVIDDLEEFIGPLTGIARSFVDLMNNSPARLFSHQDGTVVTFEGRPAWLNGIPVQSDNGCVRLSLRDVRADLAELQSALEMAVRRLPVALRDALGRALGDGAGSVTAGQHNGSVLDAFLRTVSRYDGDWEALLLKCRMPLPAAQIARFVLDSAGDTVQLSGIDDDVLRGRWDLQAAKLELFLAPSASEVKDPLAPLLRAIVNGARIHGYRDHDGPRPLHLAFRSDPAMAMLEIELRDEGSGFGGLQHYEPKGGDLSTALAIAAEWFDVTIASGGIQRRVASRGVGAPEPSPVVRGTKFLIRIPACRFGQEA